MSQSVAMNVNILLRSLIKSVGVLYLMVSLSWKLTLVTFIEAPLIAITQKIYNTYYEVSLTDLGKCNGLHAQLHYFLNFSQLLVSCLPLLVKLINSGVLDFSSHGNNNQTHLN